MILWLLPTFLWTGKALEKNDRPFQFLNKVPQNVTKYRLKSSLSGDLLNTGNKAVNKRKDDYEYLPKPKSETEIKSRFIRIYNRLLCPQCIAMQATIQGVVVSKIFRIFNST